MTNRRISPNIKPAGYGKSLLAYALDFGFTFALMVLLYFLVGRLIIEPISGYKQANEDYVSYVQECNLADVNDGVIADLSYDAIGNGTYNYGYEEYEKRIWHYYAEVVALPEYPHFSFLESDGFTPTVTDTSSNEYKIEVGKYVYQNKFGILGDDTGKGDVYFVLPETEEGYLSMPSLKASFEAKLKGDDPNIRENAASSILNFFRSTTYSGTMYAEAVNHFNAQASIHDAQTRISVGNYLVLLPSTVVAPLVFFFLIPLFTPNGKTLGKTIVKLAVIGDDGYKAKKANIILHYAFILLEWEALIIPNMAIGIMVWMFLSIIGFMVLVMSKNHQSIHDKISRTIVINARESIWFEDEESEKAYAEANPSSLVAKALRMAQGKDEPTEINGRKLVVSDATLEIEDQILDLSTINRRREEARNITSFDAFERGETEEKQPIETEEKEEETEEVILTDEERKDLEAIYGSEELLEEESEEKEPEDKKEKELDEDDFVDR